MWKEETKPAGLPEPCTGSSGDMDLPGLQAQQVAEGQVIKPEGA